VRALSTSATAVLFAGIVETRLLDADEILEENSLVPPGRAENVGGAISRVAAPCSSTALRSRG